MAQPKRLVLSSKSQGSAKLVLIDGNAILHRAYHALPPLTSRSGQLVNAVYGFCTMMLRVIGDLRPTHLAVAFDTEKPTFRHAAYVGYQAQRPRLESELADQIIIVQEVLGAMGIPIYIAPGYEADDIIGTLAFQATSPKNQKSKIKNQKLEVIIVSGDRDLLQLVEKNVKVYAPMKGLSEAHLFDEGEVKEYMGIAPSQIVDYKALIGDASDNYPGVPGIGPKTAVVLLQKYRTLNGLYENLKKLPATLIQKLSEGYESAVLSRELAQIRTDTPIDFDIKSMRLKAFLGNQRLISKFQELGFKSLVARLQTQRAQNGPQRTQRGNKEKQLRLV